MLLFGLGVRPSSLDFVPVGGVGFFELFSGLFSNFSRIFFFIFSLAFRLHALPYGLSLTCVYHVFFLNT